MKLLSGMKLSLAAMALVGFAVAGQAQVEAFRGSFTITKQLHWGNTVLEPGDYTVKVTSGGSPMVALAKQDGRGIGFVMPVGISKCKSSGVAALLVAAAGNQRTVYSLSLPEQGIELTFRPDLKREMQRAELARNNQTVPVFEAKR